MSAPNSTDEKYVRHCLGSLLDDDSHEAMSPSRRPPATVGPVSQLTAFNLSALQQKTLGPIGCERKRAKPNCWPRPISAYPPQSVFRNQQQARRLNSSAMKPCPTCAAASAPQRQWPARVALASNTNSKISGGGGMPIQKRVRSINGKTVVNGINLAGLKFLKPTEQCFQWDNPNHRREQPNCTLWHPRSLCRYYPHCRLTAEVCGFGHPFCSREGYCQCPPNKRLLQEHHRVAPLHVLEAKVYMKARPSSSSSSKKVGEGGKVNDKNCSHNDVKT